MTKRGRLKAEQPSLLSPSPPQDAPREPPSTPRTRAPFRPRHPLREKPSSWMGWGEFFGYSQNEKEAT
jgi:hypothetical protein